MSAKMSEFEQAGQDQAAEGVFSEYWSFLSHNKKWWLLPILCILLLFGALLLFSSSAAAPFIYTLF
jgi:hypothetical protein